VYFLLGFFFSLKLKSPSSKPKISILIIKKIYYYLSKRSTFAFYEANKIDHLKISILIMKQYIITIFLKIFFLSKTRFYSSSKDINLIQVCFYLQFTWMFRPWNVSLEEFSFSLYFAAKSDALPSDGNSITTIWQKMEQFYVQY